MRRVLDACPWRYASIWSIYSSPELKLSLCHTSMRSRWLFKYASQCPCGYFGFDVLGHILHNPYFASAHMWEPWSTIAWSGIARMSNSTLKFADVVSRPPGWGPIPLHTYLHVSCVTPCIWSETKSSIQSHWLLRCLGLFWLLQTQDSTP